MKPIEGEVLTKEEMEREFWRSDDSRCKQVDIEELIKHYKEIEHGTVQPQKWEV